MKYMDWKTAQFPQDDARRLELAGFSPLVSAVFASRGLDADAVRELTSEPSTNDFLDPMLMKDMALAVERIKKAVAAHERVAVFGDYDVDGITSTSLLFRYFCSLGLDCTFYIPDRLGEGYGLSNNAIDTLCARGTTLIVTVDCGITAYNEAAYARSLGIDMVITDHHECQGELPAVCAAIDPKRADCPYPNKYLAGVGVAFKLICALEGPGNEAELIDEFGELVALGTIADVMPVTGENRSLIKLGMQHIGSGRFLGLHYLIEEAGLGEKGVTCTNVGYSLAPRINAAGRMGRAKLAAELLLTLDSVKAQELAHELCSLNRDRQQLEASIFAEALEMLRVSPPGNAPIVLASETWHQGVAGIVASRLAERFCLPTVIICFDGDSGRGSCRSYGDFSIFAALDSAADLLDDFGGHELAAGLVVDRKNLDALRERLAEYYCAHPAPSAPVLSIDVEITRPQMLTINSVQALTGLEPFGRGNEQPVFCLSNARLRSVLPIGGGKHVKLSVSALGQNYECAFFSKPASELGFRPGDTVDIAFWPQINEFRGNRSVQLLLCAIRPGMGMAKSDLLIDKFENGAPLQDFEAKLLCPERQDFVALWRCILPACKNRPLVSPLRRMVYSLSSACGVSAPKCRVCLAVFSELGLLIMEDNGENTSVSLPAEQKKVDLEESAILKNLRR